MRYVFLTAFRNESAIIETFLTEFADMVKAAGIDGRSVLHLVDDVSFDDGPERVERFPATGFEVHLLRAPTNLGNQGAMFFGITHIDVAPDDVLVTFDCDGEDDVRQIRSILDLGASAPGKLVLIERGSRRESLAFKVFFAVYKRLFRFLTQRTVIPNNFLLIPGRYVPAIRRAPLAAVHLAYGVLRLNPPHVVTSRDRRPRYGGKTSQNLFMLVSHGMVGLMVFYEVVVAKLFLLAFALGLVEIAIVAAMLAAPREHPEVEILLLAAGTGTALAATALLALLLAASIALLLKLAAYNLIAAGERGGAPALPPVS